MDLLKTKIKASSLVEVIVATVIIVIIFGIATLTLNNIIKNNYRSNTHNINNHLNKIIYLYQNNKITIPFQDTFNQWEIETSKTTQNNLEYIVFTASHQKTNKIVSKKTVNEN